MIQHSPIPEDSPLHDPHHQRETMRMVKRALKQWELPDEWREALPKLAMKIVLQSKDTRAILRAIEVIAGMAKQNMDVAVAMDKLDRLDNGNPTDIVGAPIKFADEASHRLNALHE